ncbi:TadE/TadG family type IV pilus assembly protein [Neobacillus mesonae]|uniref:TadE/TadG family type IV pilus assembly protein n=1 Tax=Neobacillus mesonae TaxID=1193713 RepID=UPI0008359139|nr:Tad domain-containing protein [Neobacillus mesonae]
MKILLKLLNLRDESGATLVIVALSMVALMGFATLTIDGGRLYSEKSKLQKAMDATVLAGAQGLRTSEARAREIAEEVSEENGFKVSTTDVTFPTGDSIKAAKEVNVPMTFARVIGINYATVGATATAKVAPLKKASGVAPIVVEEKVIPGVTSLNCTNPGNKHGNCGFIRLGDNKGNSDLANAILNGGTYQSGQPVDTEPGGMGETIKNAFQTLINNDKGKIQCQKAETADNSCDRVITVVVIKNWEGCKGQCERDVIYLASYWIKEIKGDEIIGEFIKRVGSGEIESGTGTGIGEYALYGVKLIE